MEATPRSSVPKPTSLVSTKNEEKYQVSGTGLVTIKVVENDPLPVIIRHSTLSPEAPEWYERPLTASKKERVTESDHYGTSSSPSEEVFHKMLELHQHKNALQRQQKHSMEMLAIQQK